MVNTDELEGFRPSRYFSRAWALMTMERGWIKVVLVMMVALLVPVVGLLGVVGYAAEWGRLIAWGTNSAPKRHDVRVGGCIASGWRIFVVALVWVLCMSIIGGVLTAVPLLGGLLGLAWTVFTFFLYMVLLVANLRTTIYQRIRAGLRIKTIWQMAMRDTSGLMRILGMLLLCSLVLGAVLTVVAIASLASVLPAVIYWMGYFYDFSAIMSYEMRGMLAVRMVLDVLAALGPGLLVMVLVCAFVGSVTWLLAFSAMGLWMRQFDVASWGREEDPVPGLDTPSAPGAPHDMPADPAASHPAAGQDAPSSWDEPAPRPAPAPGQAPDGSAVVPDEPSVGVPLPGTVAEPRQDAADPVEPGASDMADGSVSGGDKKDEEDDPFSL